MNMCIACEKPAAFQIRALEVRTLHIRDLGGEKRVQALGDFVQYAVCQACAEKKLALETNPAAMAKPRVIRFGLVLTAGILLEIINAAFLSGQLVFTVLGVAAILCGILGIIGAIRDSREKRDEMIKLSPSDMLEEAAWDVFLQYAPHKEGDNRITYIPYNRRALSRKKGDLMILYHLLPDIAKEAYQRIHSEVMLLY